MKSLFLSILLLMFTGSVFSETVRNWNASVQEGEYNAPSSWTGQTIPADTESGYIGGNYDTVVKIPANGLSESSQTLFCNLSLGRSMTLDAAGTWWGKDNMEFSRNNQYKCFAFSANNMWGGHFFDVERSEVGSVPRLMLVSNIVAKYTLTQEGKISFSAMGGNNEKGVWSFPDTSSVVLFFGGTVVRNTEILFSTNVLLSMSSIVQRGRGPNVLQRVRTDGNAEMRVTGGLFSFDNTANASPEAWTRVECAGESAMVFGGAITLVGGSGPDLVTSEVEVAEHGRMYVGTTFTLSSKSNTTANLFVRDSGLLTVINQVIVGNAGTGYLELSGDGTMKNSGQYLIVASRAGSTGTVALRGGTLIVSGLRKGMGHAGIIGDGGTLQTCTPNVTVLSEFPEAVLGAGGLTLDTLANNVSLNQKFTDAEGVNGLFMKTGNGTLAVSNSLSHHAKTTVAGGTLLFTAADTIFGREMIVTNNAKISLDGMANKLSVDRLVLGDTDRTGVLELNSGDVVEINETNGLTVNQGIIALKGWTPGETYPLFRISGTVSPSTVDRLSFMGQSDSSIATFSVTEIDGNSVISVMLSGGVSAQDGTWTGSLGRDWTTTENWSGGIVPNAVGTATFPENGLNQSVTVNGSVKAKQLNVTGGQYSLNGDGIINLLSGVAVAQGSSLAVNTPVYGIGTELALSVAGGTELTFNENLVSSAATMKKSGSGRLTLVGNAVAWSGGVEVNGGTFALASPFLGENSAQNALTVKAGTIEIAQGISAMVSRGVTVDSGNSLTVWNTQGDFTLSGMVTTPAGGMVKRGKGTWTLNVPAGSSVLSTLDGGGALGGAVSFPASGDMPASLSGLCGLSLLEGKLIVKGGNAARTTVRQENASVLGGNYPAAAEAELVVDNVTFLSGGPSKQMIFGARTPAGGSTHPTLRIVNAGEFRFNTIYMGGNPQVDTYPTIVVSNATLATSWLLDLNNPNAISDKVHPRLYLYNSKFNIFSRDSNYYSGSAGLYLRQNSDVLVTDGSVIDLQRLALTYAGSAGGTMRVDKGSIVKVRHILGKNTLSENGMDVTFDDATLEFTYGINSVMANPVKQGLTIGAGGLKLAVYAFTAGKHEVNFPIRGSGTLHKTGDGTLVLGKTLAYVSSSQSDETGIVTASHTGGTVVDAGTLCLKAGSVSPANAVTVQSGTLLDVQDSAVFGSVSGNGTVTATNGTLHATYVCRVTTNANDCLTFRDVSIDTPVEVTFACGNTDPSVFKGEKRAIAKLTGTTPRDLSKWKGGVVDSKHVVTLSVEEDTLYATLKVKLGAIILLR